MNERPWATRWSPRADGGSENRRRALDLGLRFANSSVHDQLAVQQITFPSKAAFAHAKADTEITPSMIPSVSQYAGQQLTTGPQAEAHASHFIAVHLSEMPYAGVYSKVRAAAMAQPTNAKLQALKTTVFQGTTLRDLLLEAYAFWTIGQIMLWGAIASFAGAPILALLVGWGSPMAAGPLLRSSRSPRRRRPAPPPDKGSPTVDRSSRTDADHTTTFRHISHVAGGLHQPTRATLQTGRSARQ